jgi:uncharacterized phage protein gp47/JayE
MQIDTKDLDTLVSEQAAAIQAKSAQPVDFSVGSVLRALAEAFSSVVLWLQSSILKVLATTRASTSTGTDLATWMADYDFARLAAVPATGMVTFSRFTPTQQAVIPVGALVQTKAAVQYSVVADTANSAYSANLDGYVIGAGIGSINVPVQAVIAGSAANVTIGEINTISQAIQGLSTVTNAAVFTNGVDVEVDSDFRTRFQLYIASLSKATKGAIEYAIESARPGIRYSLVENQNYDGSVHKGYFYAVVDDGTGAPTQELIGSVNNAIESVRAVSVTFGVFSPVVVPANLAMTIQTADGYDHVTVVSLVSDALTNYVNSLGLGNDLMLSRLAQVAHDASIGVSNVLVSSLRINGSSADLVVTNQQVIRAGTIAVA